VPGLSETASRAGAGISGGEKKLMKGVPAARADFRVARSRGRSCGATRSSGSMNVVAGTEPGASFAT